MTPPNKNNNNNIYMYIQNQTKPNLKLNVLARTRLSRSTLVDTDYKYIIIRDFVDK